MAGEGQRLKLRLFDELIDRLIHVTAICLHGVLDILLYAGYILSYVYYGEIFFSSPAHDIRIIQESQTF